MYFNRALSYLALGDERNAFYDFSDAIKANPKKGEPYSYRAKYQISTDHLSGAITTYKQAIRKTKLNKQALKEKISELESRLKKI